MTYNELKDMIPGQIYKVSSSLAYTQEVGNMCEASRCVCRDAFPWIYSGSRRYSVAYA